MPRIATTAAWPRYVSRGLLILAVPLFVGVAIGMAIDVWRGVAGVFSGREVVQVAGTLDTGVVLVLLLAALAWLLRLSGAGLRGDSFIAVWMYGALLLVPLIWLGGYIAKLGLEQALQARGYAYCAYHLTSNDRGGSGYDAYVRADRPGACDRVKAMYPAGKVVDGGNAAFDLPP